MSGRVKKVRRSGGTCALLYDWDDGWVVNVVVKTDGRCLSLRCHRCFDCGPGCLLGDLIALTENGDVVRLKVSKLRICRTDAEQQHPADAISLCVTERQCEYGALAWGGAYEVRAVGEEKWREEPKIKVAGYFSSVRFEYERWVWEALVELYERCGSQHKSIGNR
ncbi:MAG: hypothetical protein ACPL3C_02150 [Pyrobaculum sp.]